jgi:hypothetical protein
VAGRGPLVEVEGMANLRRLLRRIGPDLLPHLRAAHQAVARTVTAAARPRAPHRTGRLAASVRPGATVAGALVRAGNGRVPYAGPIHYGWPARHIAAHPFVIDAARSTEPVWTAAYLADIERTLS